MGRLRFCRECTDSLPPDDPARSPSALFPGTPGSVLHPADDWPHELDLPGQAPAVHDDAGFQRAYGPGMASGLGRVFETRTAHRDYLRSNGIAEGASDTPGPAPRAQAAYKHKVRKRLEEAFYRAKRKGW